MNTRTGSVPCDCEGLGSAKCRKRTTERASARYRCFYQASSRGGGCYLAIIRWESNFLASTHPATALCVCVCCIVCLCDCVMVIREPRTQMMQHTHTHKAMTGRVEAKKLLSCRRQSDYRLGALNQGQWIIKENKRSDLS